MNISLTSSEEGIITLSHNLSILYINSDQRLLLNELQERK